MVQLMVANVVGFALLFLVEVRSGMEDLMVDKSLLGFVIWVGMSIVGILCFKRSRRAREVGAGEILSVLEGKSDLNKASQIRF